MPALHRILVLAAELYFKWLSLSSFLFFLLFTEGNWTIARVEKIVFFFKTSEYIVEKVGCYEHFF